MTRIDFYILADSTLQARHAFTCRLAEKAFHLGHRVYIHATDADESQTLDELLWSFRSASFIPHALLGEWPEAQRPPVEIGHDIDPDGHHDVMINLHPQVPAFFSRFQRLSEVVIQEQRVLDSTRSHYRFYSERNYPLHNHDLRRTSG